jgi:uncharacterized membrane protein YeiH
VSAATTTPTSRLILIADLAGTAVFGIEGALAAMQGGLDLLGILVLAFATALGGGIVRDLLIGAAPPNAIRDWRYSAVALLAGLLTFVALPAIRDIPGLWIVTLDAAGLALFAVAGTEKALDYRIHPFVAALMGTITGVGGGTIRDVLLAQIPAVLRIDIYATAALAGSIVVVLGRYSRLPPAVAAIAGGLTCFALRLLSVHYYWHLPTSFR